MRDDIDVKKMASRKIERKINNISKGGQIEMFGLAVIVILIFIGLFIFVSFRSQQKPDTAQKDYTNDKLANDFVLSILNVNIRECYTYTVKDLIIDCSRDHRVDCNGMDSCIALNQTVNTLLEETFVSMNSRFRFYSENIQYNGIELINITNLNCTPNMKQGQRGTAIISLYPDPRSVYINMNICS